MDTCIFCHGTIDLTTHRCQQCGQLQPTWLNAPTVPAAAGAAMATRRCPQCGADLPQWMSFCGYCGRSLSPLAGHAPDSGFPSPNPSVPSSPGTAHLPPPGVAPRLEHQADGQRLSLLPQGNAPTAISPILAPPQRSASAGAGPGVRPERPKARPLGKRIIIGVGVLVASILSILAVVQGNALLHRGTLAPASSSALPGRPTFAAGAPGTISEVPLPTTSAIDNLNSITAGPDGNVWFAEQSVSGKGKNVGRITPQGVITEFPVFTMDNGPLSIAAGPDGNLWFTVQGNQIGRITPEGIVTLMPLSLSFDGELPGGGIVAGPDGNLWFTDSDQIACLSPGGKLTEFPLSTSDSADYFARDITVGPDGSLWFTAIDMTNSSRFDIGRITLKGVVTLSPLPSGASLQVGIATGPDGNLWFTENNKIGRITPQGVFTEFPLPNGKPTDIATGPDGNLWFTNIDGTIGRITPGGKITEFRVADGYPTAITVGPDGNIWFAESGDNGIVPMIGRIILGK